MSGGEQQMLALARALMLAPRILLIDEPSGGLAPVLVSRTIDKISELKDQYKLTVLMAEQNFPQALRIADRGYVIVHGQIAVRGPLGRRAQQQRADPQVLSRAVRAVLRPHPEERARSGAPRRALARVSKDGGGPMLRDAPSGAPQHEADRGRSLCLTSPSRTG
jgi:ABC-type multidrug transport system ATPase subunit